MPKCQDLHLCRLLLLFVCWVVLLSWAIRVLLASSGRGRADRAALRTAHCSPAGFRIVSLAHDKFVSPDEWSTF